jgi:uncharacterized protein with HEPN domain
MSKTDRDVKLFINDILEAIGKIERYVHGKSYQEFQKDEKTKDAVVRNLEIIGEAVRNIPENFKEKYPDVDWKAAAGMRDKLIHEYFGVSLAIVWETVKSDLPPFEKRLMEISKEMEE